MLNGRITRSDIRNFTAYINQMDEDGLICAFYNLQALRKKYGGVIIDKDYQVLNQIIQWRAFCVIGNPNPKSTPFWMPPDFSTRDLEDFMRKNEDNMWELILHRLNKIYKNIRKKRKKHGK